MTTATNVFEKPYMDREKNNILGKFFLQGQKMRDVDGALVSRLKMRYIFIYIYIYIYVYVCTYLS